MTQPIIDVDHVTKEFVLGEPPSLRKTAANLLRRVTGRPVDVPAPFKALDDVSFQVAPGEVLGIIGHNGAGKSTLLKILARISEPTKGAVRVRGRVAPLIEVGAGLMPDMTGRENVFLNASILGMKKDEIRRRFDEIVDFAEIAEFVDTPCQLLERQIERPCDMTLFAHEVVRTADIEDQALRVVGAFLQFRDREHGLQTQTGDEPRHEGDDGEQRQRDQGIADRACAAGNGLTAGKTQVGVSHGSRQHEHEARDHIVQQRDAGQAEGIVEEIEGEQRHQSCEGDKAPALRLHAVDEPL